MLRQIRWKIWAVICTAILVLVAVYYYGVVREDSGKEPAVYSVVLYQNTDNEWATLVQGIQQAEEDFKVKVNYIYLSDKDTAQEQAQRMEREMNAGVSGILVAAVDSQGLKDALEGLHIQIPIITVESGMDGYLNISADNYQMGYDLGCKILEDMEADPPKQRLVTVIKEYMERDSVAQRYQGLVDALKASDQEIRIQDRSRQEGDFSLQLFIGTIFDNCGEYIVALDKFSTEEAAAAWESKRGLFEPQGIGIKIYGIGNTAQTVNDLDNRRLRALVCQNEFNIGYEGIQALVQKEQKGYVNDQFDIMYKLVTKDTLYESENEQLLFPSI